MVHVTPTGWGSFLWPLEAAAIIVPWKQSVPVVLPKVTWSEMTSCLIQVETSSPPIPSPEEWAGFAHAAQDIDAALASSHPPSAFSYVPCPSPWSPAGKQGRGEERPHWGKGSGPGQSHAHNWLHPFIEGLVSKSVSLMIYPLICIEHVPHKSIREKQH